MAAAVNVDYSTRYACWWRDYSGDFGTLRVGFGGATIVTESGALFQVLQTHDPP